MRNDAGTRIPSAWQFLHIDTPTVPDGEEITNIAPRLDDDEYMGLIGPNMTFPSLVKLLDGSPGLRPRVANLARQSRRPGRAARARRRPDACHRPVGRHGIRGPHPRTAGGAHPTHYSAEAQGELAGLFNVVEGSASRIEPRMYIVVVSSLAGGTGAGLLNLVCDILRAMDTPASDRIFAILYTPEVFQSLGKAASGGVHPNSWLLCARC